MAEVFGGVFDPERWRNVIWRITSVFESGRPEGNPAAYQTVDAGIISYGKHQATLQSGTLAAVLDEYLRRSQSDTARALEAEYAARIRNRDASLRNDGRLKALLLQAAQEQAMVQAQDEVFARNFYQPAVEHARRRGLRSPLGLANVYDTRIQGGLSIVAEATESRLGGSGVGKVGLNGVIDEEMWIRTFLDEREARLHRLADRAEANGQAAQANALRISTFRCTELRKLVDAGNWGLEGTFSVRTQQVEGLPPTGRQPAREGVPNARFVSFHSSADLDGAPEGGRFTNTWRVRNTGETTWGDATTVRHIHAESGSKLMTGSGSFRLAQVADKAQVAPGEEVEITIEMIAPEARDRFYFTDWQLHDRDGRPFGDVLWLRVVVVEREEPPSGLLSSDSQFVRDLTVEDGTVFQAGESFTKRWLIRNTGQRKWGQGYRLVFVGGDSPMTGTVSHLAPEAQPGEEVVVSVPMVAPTTPRAEPYVSTWRLHDDRNTPFGTRMWAKIHVTPSDQPLPATPLSQNDPRWKNRVLGHGPLTFGQFGCLVTCYAMMLNAFGEDVTPLDLQNRFLQLPAGQGFDGSIIMFRAPAAAFDHVLFEGNFKPRPETGATHATFDAGLIDRIDRRLSDGGMVLAQVDQTPATAYNPNVEQHWVLLVARSGNDYLALDPLDGQAISLLAKYGQQAHAEAGDAALKQAIKSALFYRSTRRREPEPRPEAEAVRLGVGMNVNPDAPHSNPLESDVLNGIQWVRYPFKAADKRRSVQDGFGEYDPIVRGYAGKGIGSLIVLNQQTVAGDTAPWAGAGNWDTYADRFAQAAGQIAARYADLGEQVAYEIWNEGDNPETPWVSVFVPPPEFAKVLGRSARAIRDAAPEAKVIFGGLSTGPADAVSYVQQVQVQAAVGGELPVDAIGVHPYGRWPVSRPFPGWGFGKLDDTFNVFKTAFPNTPLWLTEIGIPGGNNPLGEEHYPAVAGYMRDLFRRVAQEFVRQVPVIVWFAWSDNMLNAGVVESDGKRKAHVFDAFKAVRDRTLEGMG